MICLFFILLLKYNDFGDFVEKKRVKMIREQKIDEELLIEEQEMEAYQIDENEIIYEGKTKEGPFMMKFMFIEGDSLYSSFQARRKLSNGKSCHEIRLCTQGI